MYDNGERTSTLTLMLCVLLGFVVIGGCLILALNFADTSTKSQERTIVRSNSSVAVANCEGASLAACDQVALAVADSMRNQSAATASDTAWQNIGNTTVSLPAWGLLVICLIAVLAGVRFAMNRNRNS